MVGSDGIGPEPLEIEGGESAGLCTLGLESTGEIGACSTRMSTLPSTVMREQWRKVGVKSVGNVALHTVSELSVD